MKKMIVLLIALMLLSIADTPAEISGNFKRFKKTYFQKEGMWEMAIIKDTETDREYLFVRGVGITLLEKGN